MEVGVAECEEDLWVGVAGVLVAVVEGAEGSTVDGAKECSVAVDDADFMVGGAKGGSVCEGDGELVDVGEDVVK